MHSKNTHNVQEIVNYNTVSIPDRIVFAIVSYCGQAEAERAGIPHSSGNCCEISRQFRSGRHTGPPRRRRTPPQCRSRRPPRRTRKSAHQRRSSVNTGTPICLQSETSNKVELQFEISGYISRILVACWVGSAAYGPSRVP